MIELPKAFEAQNVEKKWYQFWQERKLFQADPTSKKPAYCIMMPPPNVTGVLHMGHALVSTLQDILIRYKRMSGFDTLWLPGTDHAGIATQTVVERHILRTQGKRRSDFSRDDFLKIVWEWKEKSETEILDQLKIIGCSCDWDRKRFTMDPAYCKAVRTMFKKLYSQGLIYRDDYLVNWDPVTQTALADDEVEYEEKNGFLWHFSYPLVDGSGAIEIATTRPETMLGDTAVAVSAKDDRYRHMIGKMVLQPMTGHHIPVIADDHVDPSFGTGAVKITPAHDHDDYLMAGRHNLPMINIMTQDGKINQNGGSFHGMSMQDARVAIVQAMTAKGFFVKQTPHLNRVGVSYRSKAIIEPHLSKQWFVKMTAFKEQLKDIVRQGKTKLIPTHWNSTYFHWIDNLHDWCISRQLWWGHRIPIWYHKTDKEQIICYEGEGIPEEVSKAPDDWFQDPDVLDTWFSSSIWPFATLGWPEMTPELQKYYPNSTLITGHDILFFWVARMLMMGSSAQNEVPFPETFLHGLIYGKSYWRQAPGTGIAYVTEDERKSFDLGKELPKDVMSKWEKMSKSKGNIIDPTEIVNEYGADACRMALASSTTEAPQIDLDRRRFEEYRNFANKVWNGARFIFMNLEGLSAHSFSTGIQFESLRLEDHWILERLQTVCKEVNKGLSAYTFDKAAISAYEFYWNELCAYYLEISKPVLFGKMGTPTEKENKQKLLVILLLQAIRLMHPMAPFITEELFQLLKQRMQGVTLSQTADSLTQEAIQALLCDACIIAPYPQPHTLDCKKEVHDEFQLLTDLVYAIRNIRGEMKIAPGQACDVSIISDAENGAFRVIQDHAYIISSLVKVKEVSFTKESLNNGPGSTAIVSGLTVWVPLPQEMCLQEKSRLIKEEEKLQKTIEMLEQKLGNSQFLEKAPREVVQKLLDSKEQSLNSLQTIKAQLNSIHSK